MAECLICIACQQCDTSQLPSACFSHCDSCQHAVLVLRQETSERQVSDVQQRLRIREMSPTIEATRCKHLPSH